MKPRQLFLLAALLGLGAVVSAVVPSHPLFNQPAGPVVLGGMGALSAAAGLAVWIGSRKSDSRGTVAEPGAAPDRRRP